ncbi:GlmL-related ornithine degradation protein [Candidatus Clostridium stratigraminis]|uniref:GlmL-related ornithine degradation protein n=1 Tax=Candidatus Clostridium stratigraminis TaxID=3381661 RepID=A0ABW8T6V4_9CLOT
MKADYLISEVGSTTTVVTAFKLTDMGIEVAAQGKSYTTVLEGDVTIGLRAAIKDMERECGEEVTWNRMLSTSSAAGGLKITVHGLVEDMTVKAAKEAALGAGGNIKLVTAGKLRKSDIKKIKEIDPNLIMIAGGTDYGERETALYNSELINTEISNKPIIYCGNIANHEEIKEIFENKELYIVDNVFPRIDELNVEPSRKIIQNAFENNIIKAPGMNKIKEMVDGTIMPTPGAVMESAKLLYELLGDVLVLDVGGATTDVHSVTDGSTEILDILVSPEPKAKRTVEGDLGVYVNSANIINLLDVRDIKEASIESIRENIKPIPTTEEEINASSLLTKKAVEIALNRHVGYIKRSFGATKTFLAYGKDLSKIKYIVGTGGALTRLPYGENILNDIRYTKEDMSMLPKSSAKVLLDKNYIMACAGVLSKENKEAAICLLRNSLGI